jgi:hypothetical protein
MKIIWGLGIGDWGLGIGDWGLGPIPNPQSPIPNTQSPYFCQYNLIIILKYKIYIDLNIFNILKINNNYYHK